MDIRVKLAAMFLIGVPILAACSSASMRVDVHVYKGHLSKTVPVQVGELAGLILEAKRMFQTYEKAVDETILSWGSSKFRHKKNCTANSCTASRETTDTKCKHEKNSTATVEGTHDSDCSAETVKYLSGCDCSTKFFSSACRVEKHVLFEIYSDVKAFQCQLERLDTDSLQSAVPASGVACKCTQDACSGIAKAAFDISQLASRLKARSFYWAETHAGYAPRSRKVRITMASFANLTAELANQLETRADALQWQLCEGKGAGKLPLSVYLRNTEPTDVVNLYTWNRAAAPALLADMFLRPSVSFSAKETADRVRLIERLFSDHNWAKINTVYGSGQGKFAMALVKSDLGNWNLKSFQSDSTEMVKAYMNLIKIVFSPGPAKLSSPTPPSSLPVSPMIPFGVSEKKQLHGEVLKELEAIKLEANTAEAVKAEAVKAEANTAEAPDVSTSKKQIEQIREVLKDHIKVIRALQEMSTR